MIDLAEKTFELVENHDGHALGQTTMRFKPDSKPLRASYSGPNVVYGEAIVSGDDMLYHALSSGGQMSAGQAKVIVHKKEGALEMVLQWHWLTGEPTSGISKWRQVGV